jgi:hypothetical protein
MLLPRAMASLLTRSQGPAALWANTASAIPVGLHLLSTPDADHFRVDIALQDHIDEEWPSLR